MWIEVPLPNHTPLPTLPDLTVPTLQYTTEVEFFFDFSQKWTWQAHRNTEPGVVEQIKPYVI